MPNSTFWKKFFLVIKVIEVRLRFIAILLVTALAIGYWDTIANYWDKWTQPRSAAVRALDPGQEFKVRNRVLPRRQQGNCLRRHACAGPKLL